MQELRDSSDIIQNSPALSERLARDGVLFFRGLLDADDIYRLRSEILLAIGNCGWTAQGKDPRDALPSERKRKEMGEGWWDGYHAIQSLESFHAFAYNPDILATLKTIFGENVLVHPRKIARVIYPDFEEATTLPHQDFPLIGGTVDFFTMWIPLGDVSRSQGGLRVLLGSHEQGVRSASLDLSTTGASSFGVRDVDDDPDWATADYRAGDAVVFHSLTIHGGVPNISDRLRLSVDYRYQPQSEPLNALSTMPHYYEKMFDIPPWEEFTGGWKSTKWIETPSGIGIVPPDFILATGKVGKNAGKNNGVSRFVESRVFYEQARQQLQLWDPVQLEGGAGM